MGREGVRVVNSKVGYLFIPFLRTKTQKLQTKNRSSEKIA